MQSNRLSVKFCLTCFSPVWKTRQKGAHEFLHKTQKAVGRRLKIYVDSRSLTLQKQAQAAAPESDIFTSKI